MALILKKEYKLKMLWHSSFWDYPLDGLAEYNNEKVYFKIKDHDVVDKYSLPAEIISKINAVELQWINDIYEATSKTFGEDYDPEIVASLDDYEIHRYDKFVIKKKITYDIYRMPDDILKLYEDKHDKWCDYYNSYTSWHLPEKFNNSKTVDTTTKITNLNNEPMPNFDVKNFEHLGTFKYDEFEYFDRRPLFFQHPTPK